MGNCFSLITTRQGRKRFRFGIQQKSFSQTGTSGKSPTSGVSTRRSVSSNATEDCEAEAASGFFSFGSDTSKYFQNADVDHPGATDSQKFGILIAQETRAEIRKATKQRDSPVGNHNHQGPKKSSTQVQSSSRPQAIPPSTKVYGDHGHMRNSPGGPRNVERADHGQMRNSPGPRLVEREDPGRVRNSPGGPRNVERAVHGLVSNSPGRTRLAEKAREKPDHGPIRNSPAGPRNVEKADRGHMRKNSLGSLRPVEKADHGHLSTSSPGGPKSLEEIALSAVVDSLNLKGRQELERLRGFSPEFTENLKKVTARNESFNRNGTGLKGNGRYSGPLYTRQHAPVDFDFLAEKFVNDSSRPGKQTSPVPKVEAPKETDENDPIDHSGTGTSKSSLTMQDIDEFAKTYKESAAKAAARDRDMFKSMSAGESIDVSLTSSMGSSPAIRPDIRPEKRFEMRPETWPEIRPEKRSETRPMRNSHTRSASTLALPELEIVPAPVTFGTLIKLDSPSKAKAASPPIPRSAVTRSRTVPVISRPGMKAAAGRGASPAARGGSPGVRGGSPGARGASPAGRGGTRRAQSLQFRNV